MLSIREWEIGVASPHTVRVAHNLLIGKVVLSLDGREIFRREHRFWDTGCEHRFAVDGTRCLLRILYRTWHYEYELWVDGRLQ